MGQGLFADRVHMDMGMATLDPKPTKKNPKPLNPQLPSNIHLSAKLSGSLALEPLFRSESISREPN